ncbi:hypothetical protein MGG_08176 [Pyricularia oryzae 70-15]|uniref:Uncharacterized protein n=3 Tax=Pyricularia oryzae TaxID=318829 RepID=G4MZ68_PYRO7|nr:uncharacterized protein MGG_08176 [Pyricularia oryzae 70-15]EHA55341.1 hypothetical protein MGG_08176 [Pyricularia oryzae 70-15]ELQ36801.1 hypothetical protein OOU_Y34scaffold00638g6 [Pyricularia oryzae Y34]KAI7924437.1 hypothetical protein M0657_004603 [Pyricularia oryzae]KAI7926228.1 hypothetical protein M9X92_002818 [Pyricularia oryzae]
MAPTNFKTYESQARLLAAVIASAPDLKLNFKAIAAHYGSDTTTCGIEHRFRPIKKQAAAIRAAVAKGEDPKDMQDIVGMNEKEIAKYYGESTPQGLEFQFRSVKSNARKLQEVSRAGGNTATALDTTPSTPRKRKAAGSATATPASKRGKRKTAPKIEMLSDDDYDQDVDYDELDAKPRVPTQTPASLVPASITHSGPDAYNIGTNSNDGAARALDNSTVDNESVLEREADPLLSQHSLGSFDAVEDDGEC